MRNLCPSPCVLRHAALLGASAIACVTARAIQANDQPRSTELGAFTAVRVRDTIAVETFERRSDLLVGEVKAPGRPWIRYRIELDASRRPLNISLAVYAASEVNDANALQRVTAAASGDSAVIEVSGPTGSNTRRVRLERDSWLLVGQSSAELELLLATLRPPLADSAAVSVVPLLGGRPMSLAVRYFGADSAILTLGSRSTAHFDAQGRLTRLIQGAGAVVVTRTSTAAMPVLARASTYDAPVDAPYTAEHVRLTGGGAATLEGTLTLPRVAERRRVPALITISGSGPQDRDSYLPIGTGYRPFRQIADTLGRRGIAVLRVDDRGTGASTGSFAAATEVDFIADVKAAVAFLRARAEIDPDRIALSPPPRHPPIHSGRCCVAAERGER